MFKYFYTNYFQQMMLYDENTYTHTKCGKLKWQILDFHLNKISGRKRKIPIEMSFFHRQLYNLEDIPHAILYSINKFIFSNTFYLKIPQAIFQLQTKKFLKNKQHFYLKFDCIFSLNEVKLVSMIVTNFKTCSNKWLFSI